MIDYDEKEYAENLKLAKKKRYPIQFEEAFFRMIVLAIAIIAVIVGMYNTELMALLYFGLGTAFAEYGLFFLYKFRLFHPEKWWRGKKIKNN